MRDKISAAGGKVVVFGDVLSEADVYAKMLAKQDESGGVFVSPYDHELIWEGMFILNLFGFFLLQDPLFPHHSIFFLVEIQR
jgi:hypothetical protein